MVGTDDGHPWPTVSKIWAYNKQPMAPQQRCESRVNPATGRCVLKRGRVGSKLRGRPVPCERVYDRKTRRCRYSRRKTPAKTPNARMRSNRGTRRRSKARAARAPRRPLTCIPEKFNEIVQNCECHKKWGKRLRLGSGVNGAVYLACREKRSEDCDYVVKVQPHNQQARRSSKRT